MNQGSAYKAQLVLPALRFNGARAARGRVGGGPLGPGRVVVWEAHKGGKGGASWRAWDGLGAQGAAHPAAQFLCDCGRLLRGERGEHG